MVDLSSSGLGAAFARRPDLSVDCARKGWYDCGRFAGGNFLRSARLWNQKATIVTIRHIPMNPKIPNVTMLAVFQNLGWLG